MHARAGNLEAGREVAEDLLLAGDLELRERDPRAAAVRTMFIVSRPQPSAMKYFSATAITSAAVLPGA